MRRLRPLILLVIVAALGAGGYFGLARGSTSGPSYRTEAVTKADLLSSVAATGTLEPEDVIDVGAQVGGMIKSFGTAADGKGVDYGSPVEAGTVLASIDDSLYRAKAEQSKASVRSATSMVAQARAKLDAARANVAQAKANTQRAEADVKQYAAKADQAGKDYKRTKSLSGSVTQQELDAAISATDSASAAVGVSEAAVAQAKAAELSSAASVADAEAAVATAEAAVATAQAQLRQDEVNLDYCTIKSEVKGTIIDRRVTLGQTVQSSFSTPSLFLIAKDLTRMKVWASVNEADIGQIRVGMPTRFTVDAYPGRTFRGSVGRVRLNATNTQNVVVYTVEVAAANDDKKLLPYMTANLAFEVEKREGVLSVPNSALRYKPAGAAPPAEKDRRAGVVYVKDDAGLRAVPVKTGLSDGNRTEITEGELVAGAEVVVGEAVAATAGGGGTVNPFAAPRPGGGAGGGKR